MCKKKLPEELTKNVVVSLISIYIVLRRMKKITSFKGNIFSIVFLMGEIAVYHRNHVVEFMQNLHGANNLIKISHAFSG